MINRRRTAPVRRMIESFVVRRTWNFELQQDRKSTNSV
jgi:hypothetical protein